MQHPSEYYRFCPDQPDIRISDAVCLGRRRANYPYCKGCQFNDDETGEAAAGRGGRDAAAERLTMIETVFKAYDVRATYPDPLDETAAWRIGHATAVYFRQTAPVIDRASPERLTLVVGRDMRKSSPSLSAALIEGIRSTRVPVVDIGEIDTPQLVFAVNQLDAAGGIQTTASHNPAHYNGFKICGRGGAPIGEHSGLADISRIAQKVVKHDEESLGALRHEDLGEPYKAFVRRFLKKPRRMKVVVDASNGMAGKWAPVVFADVPELDITFLNVETTGEFVHEPNPLVEANLEQLRGEVRRVGADFGVCFDGDADRCVFVDEGGEIVRCDMMTALLSREFLRHHPGSAVVYDLRSSRTVADEVNRYGGKPVRERVGHAFMKKAMAQHDGVFGGELSGHFYFKENYYCDSGMLALAHVLNVLTDEGKPLGELIEPLKRYHNSGERNFETADKDGVIQRLKEVYSDARIDELDGVTVAYEDWWFNVRKSNTEPLLRLNLEADSAELLAEKLGEVSTHLGTPVAH